MDSRLVYHYGDYAITLRNCWVMNIKLFLNFLNMPSKPINDIKCFLYEIKINKGLEFAIKLQNETLTLKTIKNFCYG